MKWRVGSAGPATVRVSRHWAAGEFTAIQLATTLGENKVKLVPDVSVSCTGAGLTEALFARLLSGRLAPDGAQTLPLVRPPAA
jgi:hypothetical protein